MAHSKGKDKQKLSLKKDLMADLLNKNFKTTILKMCFDLKGDVKKVNKMMEGHSRNINKKIEDLNKSKNKL